MSDMNQVMLDIETLGREPGAAIVSIGAVKFGPNGLGDTFYNSVTLDSCDRAGLDVDVDTLSWWLDQNEAARQELTGGVPLGRALLNFIDFYDDADEVWANSPAFDCEIMEAAYRAINVPEPWKYDEERCHRTLRAFPQAADVDNIGDEHNALDDAKYQATVAYKTLNEIGYYDE